MNHTTYDAIVIGSGMGGLTSAALLAALHGRRVLVLERHYRAGGFTHTFTRPGGYRWDVGVHYVGGVDQPVMRDLYAVMSGGTLGWTRMVEGFERLVFPGFTFTIRAGAASYRDDLLQAFPGSRAAIERYFHDVRTAASYAAVIGMRGVAPDALVAVVEALTGRARRLALMTTGAYLERHVTDERLRAVLGARWGDFGLPPSRSSFLVHAIITSHYLEGAWYPEGSAASIATGARAVIEAAGGQLRVNAEVASVVMEGGRAVGVRLVNGEQLRARYVISDAGARNTYLKLVPPEVPLRFRDELAALEPGLAMVTLYLGLSGSPRSLGVSGENFWIHDALDQEVPWNAREGVASGVIPMCYLSFPSMKDPRATAHTAEIIAPVDARAFSAWRGTRWMKRGEDYRAMKARVAAALLRLVEARLPGFGELVSYQELSTPLSTEHFTAHPHGEVYGVPATPERYKKRYLKVRTPVPGLFLTGADVMVLGVEGAARAGLHSVVAAEGPATFLRLSRAARELRAAKAARAELPSAGASKDAPSVHLG